MHFITRGKNMEITPALQEYVEKRLSKLDKYLGTDDTNIARLPWAWPRKIISLKLQFQLAACIKRGRRRRICMLL